MPAIIGGALALGGALISSQASKSASKDQLAATREGSAEQRRQYDQNRADLKPWREAGTAGVLDLAYMLGLSPTGGGRVGGDPGIRPQPEDFIKQGRNYMSAPVGGQPSYPGWQPSRSMYQAGGLDVNAYERALSAWEEQKAAYDREVSAAEGDPRYGSLMRDYVWEEDPAYDFIKSEGTKAVQRDKSARGLRVSGAYDKALARFIENNANTFYNQGFQRDAANKSQKFNFLSGISNPGAQVTSQGAAIGQGNANAISDLITQGGNASAAGKVGSANAWVNAGQNFANQYFMNQFLKGNQSSPGMSSTTAGFYQNVPTGQ